MIQTRPFPLLRPIATTSAEIRVTNMIIRVREQPPAKPYTPSPSCLSTCRQAQLLAPIFLFSSEKQTSAKQPPPSRFEISAIFQPYLPPTSRSPFVRFLSRRLSIAVLANDACRASRPTPNIHLPLRNLRDSLSNGERERLGPVKSVEESSRSAPITGRLFRFNDSFLCLPFTNLEHQLIPEKPG